MWSIRLGAIGLLVSNTIGAGIFALPYIAQQSGWGMYLIYLVLLAATVAYVHGLYGETLDRVQGEKRLTGLVKLYLSRRYFAVASVSIFGGLILTLVAYIILGANFITLLIPSMSVPVAMCVMWVIGSIPLFLKPKRMVALEFIGAVAIAGLILFVFFSAHHPLAAFSGAAFASHSILFPVGSIMFSLAGWTSIATMRDYERRVGFVAQPRFSSIVWATAVVVVLYALYAFGILGSGGSVTREALSGFSGLSSAVIGALSLLGLIAIWTSYVPVVNEARDTLTHDFAWTPFHAMAISFLLPMACIAIGLNSFITVVGLVGGVFVSAQYILIVLVIKNSLRLKPFTELIMNAVIGGAIVVAVYGIYQFIVG